MANLLTQLGSLAAAGMMLVSSAIDEAAPQHDADGTERQIAEEYSVIDRNGRLQLPATHGKDLGLHDRVRVTRESGHVGVWPNEQAARRGAADDEEARR